MNVVVDASTVFVLVATPLRVEPFLVGAAEIVAPDLIVAEVLNARWKIGRSGGLAPSLALLLGLFERIRLVGSAPYATEAAALAERLDQPVHDCLYVAVAQRESAVLITADRQFARRLEDHAIAVVSIA